MSAQSRRSFLKTTAAAGLAVLPPGRLRAGGVDSPGGARHEPPGALDPLGVRDRFPVTKEMAYLNTASQGPVPIPVRQALAGWAENRMLQRSRSAGSSAVAAARERFARLFGAEEAEIALLPSTSDGENVVANAISWRAGDNVVLDELHFTTSFVLYRELEKRAGIELRIVPSQGGRAPLEAFEARTDARTRLITVAWVSNRNGYRHRLPELAELAHARGGYLYADAIQALGTFPTDLHAEGVDFACANGYKWLFSDFGCAPLYVRREHLEWMTPDRFGHGQVAETLAGHRYRLETTAAKFEIANPAYGPVTAIAAGLDFVAEVGLNRIAEHTFDLAAQLREGATDLGMNLFTPPDNPSPIVSFHHGLPPRELAAALDADGVRVTFQEEGRLLRAAVAMFNNRDDVDRLLGVLAGMV